MSGSDEGIDMARGSLHARVLTSKLASFLAPSIGGDGLLDGELDGALDDEAEIGTGEAAGIGHNVLNVDI